MKTKKIVLLLLGCTLFGVGFVTVLFLMSEEKMQRNNAFQRRYVPNAVEVIDRFSLDTDSYYIVGMDNGYIYLGHVSAPLYLTKVDTSLQASEEIKLEITHLDLPYRLVKTAVTSPNFYLGDGTVPILFKGAIKELKAEPISIKDAYFNQFAVADSSTIGISTINSTAGSIALGILKKDIEGRSKFEIDTTILQKQDKGIFDTDGVLSWNDKHQVFIYTYYYRNQYEVVTKALQHRASGTTIDTISRSILDIAHHSSRNQYKLGGKSVYVNRQSVTYGDYLYIHSDRLGKYENADVLEKASIVDVYNIIKKTYSHSFYVFHQTGKRLHDFKIFGDLFVVLVEDVLWLYRLNPDFI